MVLDSREEAGQSSMSFPIGQAGWLQVSLPFMASEGGKKISIHDKRVRHRRTMPEELPLVLHFPGLIGRRPLPGCWLRRH